MLLYEAEGKRLLRDAGFTVPHGQIVLTPEETLDAARNVGFPCVLKAQTLEGRRWKRGLVALVRNEIELQQRVDAMRSEPMAGFLIEEQVEKKAEFYVSVGIAEAEGYGVLLISPAGGVDVEEAASFVKLPLSSRRAPWSFEILGALHDAGIKGRTAVALAGAARLLVDIALENQCILAEINPLFLTEDGSVVAVDAKIELDDDARGDRSAMIHFRRETDPLEVQAAADGISFVRLDGDIGTIVGGAGLAMLTVDALSDAGLRPKNFIDLQGSSTKKFVAGFTLLNCLGGIKAVLTNNAGGLTPCVALAEGIVAGARQLPAALPIVVKLHGADEKQAWELLEASGANIHVCTGTTTDAVRMLQSLI